MTLNCLYKSLCQYDGLEAAYNAASFTFDERPGDVETWLINLQNHLIWRSYTPYEDPIADIVITRAVDMLLNNKNI